MATLSSSSDSDFDSDYHLKSSVKANSPAKNAANIREIEIKVQKSQVEYHDTTVTKKKV